MVYFLHVSVTALKCIKKKKTQDVLAVAEGRDKVLVGGKLFSNNKTKHVQNIHIRLKQPIRLPQLFL